MFLCYGMNNRDFYSNASKEYVIQCAEISGQVKVINLKEYF